MLKVSVIIPVYKAKETITACLDSVLAQTLDGMEVVLVDDHGGDGTIEAARGYAAAHSGPVRFRFTETEANSGPGIARNVGVAAATGDFVAFLDADDTLRPTSAAPSTKPLSPPMPTSLSVTSHSTSRTALRKSAITPPLQTVPSKARRNATTCAASSRILLLTYIAAPS